MRPWLLSIALALLVAGCETEDSPPAVSFGDTLKYENAREAIDARVESDGLYFATPLRIADHKGQRMEVRAYGDNGKLLGFAYATPPYDATKWDKFQIFVPEESLRGMSPNSGFDVYVVAPDDPDHYVVHEHYSQSNLKSPEIIWSWLEYRDGAVLAGGERGMSITVSLQIDGYQGQTLHTYAVVRDANLNEIGADEGGPIRIQGPVITPAYPSTSYEKLVFEVPYSRMSAVPPDRRLKITPSILIGGQIVTGNMHFTTWAGGTADDVREKIDAVARGYAEQADRLQREIDLLQREAGK